MNTNMNRKQQGFTLIELVVVIVILGILAVTAAPKFIDLQDDARTSTLNGVKGSIESVKAMVYSKSLIAGNETVDGDDADTPPVVVINGADVNVSFGYPRSDEDSVTEWRTHLLDVAVGEFVISEIASVIYITPDIDGLNTVLETAPTACFVTYTESAMVSNALVTAVTAVTDC